MKKAKDYLSEFQEEKRREKSENTVSAYMSDIRQFFGYYRKDLEELTTKDIEEYKEYLFRNRLKPKTINRKLVSIRRYIDFVNNHGVGIRILAEVKMIKIQKQEYLEELLTKSDFDRLVKAAETHEDLRAVALFYCLYLTGARVSELLQLKASDFAVNNLVIRGKGEKYRYLFPPELLTTHVNNYIRSRPENAPDKLFNMSRQTVHYTIKKYAGIAKVKKSRAHAHNFRHLYALRLIELGVPLEDVAELLGHTNINTTRIYIRKTKEQLMNAIRQLH